MKQTKTKRGFVNQTPPSPTLLQIPNAVFAAQIAPFLSVRDLTHMLATSRSAQTYARDTLNRIPEGINPPVTPAVFQSMGQGAWMQYRSFNGVETLILKTTAYVRKGDVWVPTQAPARSYMNWSNGQVRDRTDAFSFSDPNKYLRNSARLPALAALFDEHIHRVMRWRSHRSSLRRPSQEGRPPASETLITAFTHFGEMAVRIWMSGWGRLYITCNRWHEMEFEFSRVTGGVYALKINLDMNAVKSFQSTFAPTRKLDVEVLVHLVTLARHDDRHRTGENQGYYQGNREINRILESVIALFT